MISLESQPSEGCIASGTSQTCVTLRSGCRRHLCAGFLRLLVGAFWLGPWGAKAVVEMVGGASWLVLPGAIGDASERISPKPAQGDRKVENSTLRFAAFTPDPIFVDQN